MRRSQASRKLQPQTPPQLLTGGLRPQATPYAFQHSATGHVFQPSATGQEFLSNDKNRKIGLIQLRKRGIINTV